MKSRPLLSLRSLAGVVVRSCGLWRGLAALACGLCVVALPGCRLLGLLPIGCNDDTDCPVGRTCSVDGVCVVQAREGEGEGEGEDGGEGEGEGEGAPCGSGFCVDGAACAGDTCVAVVDVVIDGDAPDGEVTLDGAVIDGDTSRLVSEGALVVVDALAFTGSQARVTCDGEVLSTTTCSAPTSPPRRIEVRVSFVPTEPAAFLRMGQATVDVPTTLFQNADGLVSFAQSVPAGGAVLGNDSNGDPVRVSAPAGVVDVDGAAGTLSKRLQLQGETTAPGAATINVAGTVNGRTLVAGAAGGALSFGDCAIEVPRGAGANAFVLSIANPATCDWFGQVSSSGEALQASIEDGVLLPSGALFVVGTMTSAGALSWSVQRPGASIAPTELASANTCSSGCAFALRVAADGSLAAQRVFAGPSAIAFTSLLVGAGGSAIAGGTLGPGCAIGTAENTDGSRRIGVVVDLGADLADDTTAPLVVPEADVAVQALSFAGSLAAPAVVVAADVTGAGGGPATAMLWAAPATFDAVFVPLEVAFGAGARARGLAAVPVRPDAVAVADAHDVVFAVDSDDGASLWRVSPTGRVGWTRRLAPGPTRLVDVLADDRGPVALLACSADTRLDETIAPLLVDGAAGGLVDTCVLDLRR